MNATGWLPLVQARDWGWGAHPMMGEWGAWGGGIAVMLFFWALVLVALVVGVRWLARAPDRPRATPPVDRALETLRERYARGEIDREEFEARRRDLHRARAA